MNAVMYKSILDENLMTFLNDKIGPGAIFMDDNDPKHRSKLVKEFITAKNIVVLPWPSQSPDLNPIEHLWDELERRVRKRSFTNRDNFFEALNSEWNSIPLPVLQNLINSMPRRCAAVIASKGMATKY